MVRNEQIVDVSEFETTNPEMKGEMITAIILNDQNGHTDVVATHSHLPEDLSLNDN